MKENDSIKFDINYLLGKTFCFGRTLRMTAMFFCALASVVLTAPMTANAACSSVTSPLNVELCGALGSDYADDSQGIQDAIDALGSTGGTVYFPYGTYFVNTTIEVPSNIRLQSLGSTAYNASIRLMVTNAPLFKVEAGASNVVFKDMYLLAFESGRWPRSDKDETKDISNENTTGISLEASAFQGIEDVRIENVRTSQFTYGIAAPASGASTNVDVRSIKIRNYVSDGNHYALYTNTKGAVNWDVQNMNAYPTYENQNGIFLERSGDRMIFLQLSCAGSSGGFCVKLWDNGNTYFRQFHSEGPAGVCIGSNCVAGSPSYEGANSSRVTFENSPVGGEVHRATDLVLTNNRFWLDYPNSEPISFRFFGRTTGSLSSVKSCGNVWVSHPSSTHRINTTADKPAWDFPGLLTALQGCKSNSLVSPVFDRGYEPDNVRLIRAAVTTTLPNPSYGEIKVTDPALCSTNPAGCATNGGTNDDTVGFQLAIDEARLRGSRRIFVPAGTYDIYSTLDLKDGETIVGETIVNEENEVVPGSIINLKTPGISLFRVYNRSGNNQDLVKGVTFRNLKLFADDDDGTSGIDFENFMATEQGGASDYQIQNVDFYNFAKGITVQPRGGDPNGIEPMFDSVSIKDCEFADNKIAISFLSSNASNWNLADLKVDIPGSEEGILIYGGGNISIRHLECAGTGAASACLRIEEHTGIMVEDMSATGVQKALLAPWGSGWSQFPVSLRNNDLQAGVYIEGKIFLSSVNNDYPARLVPNSTARFVKFGYLYSGSIYNDGYSYGWLSQISSCNDEFWDPAVTSPETDWAPNIVGVLDTPVTMCN